MVIADSFRLAGFYGLGLRSNRHLHGTRGRIHGRQFQHRRVLRLAVLIVAPGVATLGLGMPTKLESLHNALPYHLSLKRLEYRRRIDVASRAMVHDLYRVFDFGNAR